MRIFLKGASHQTYSTTSGVCSFRVPIIVSRGTGHGHKKLTTKAFRGIVWKAISHRIHTNALHDKNASTDMLKTILSITRDTNHYATRSQ